MEGNYLDKNRSAWNQKTSQHIHSEFYELNAFLAGKNVLREVELNLLGDIRNKKILHMQCHFGMDSLCLSRMGAKVTGVDLSDEAIKQARQLNDDLNLDAQFNCCDLYSLPEHLDEEFDIVFTSYGTIGWLPDLEKWAKIIDRYLKPGGKFIMVDFHPFVWTFDDDMQKISYDYFKTDEIIEITEGTYADRNAPIKTETVSWNHSLDEILGSLLEQKLNLLHFGEYDYSPYTCFSNLMEREPGKFVFKHIPYRIPMMYSIVAGKN
jgi:SAM-dependent methyltransferase